MTIEEELYADEMAELYEDHQMAVWEEENTPRNKKRLVFDVDGVMIDPYTRLEGKIRKLFGDIAAQGFWPYMHGDMAHLDIHRYKRFRFHEFARNFPMDTLHPTVRELCMDYWANDTGFCKDPLPMYDNMDLFPQSVDSDYPDPWISIGKPVPDFDSRTDLITWRRLLCFLSDYYSIELHTQMLGEKPAAARRKFFSDLFSGYEFAGISVKIDVGSKAPSEGDIVVEDCLENLEIAKCGRRVLRHLWHNSKDDASNIAIMRRIARSGVPVRCYGIFSQLCLLLFGYIAEDFGMDIVEVSELWYNYDIDSKRMEML